MICLRILFFIDQKEIEIAVSTNMNFAELKSCLCQCFYENMNEYSNLIDHKTGMFFDENLTILQQGLENGDILVVL